MAIDSSVPGMTMFRYEAPDLAVRVLHAQGAERDRLEWEYAQAMHRDVAFLRDAIVRKALGRRRSTER